jgi:hypothetical protein
MTVTAEPPIIKVLLARTLAKKASFKTELPANLHGAGLPEGSGVPRMKELDEDRAVYPDERLSQTRGDRDMSIATAVKQGQYVMAYNEKGDHLFTVPVPEDCSVIGNTSSTVSTKQGQYIVMYNESGSTISTVPIG